MSNINFYHLTSLPAERALPKLLEKAYASGAHTVLRCAHEQQVEQYNQLIWTSNTKFIPHGSKKDGYEAKQPIYLTAANENPNGATILALLSGASLDQYAAFEKCLYVFDGTKKEELEAARHFWKQVKDEGHVPVYWQQDSKAGWQKKDV